MTADFKPLTLTPVEFSLTDGTQIPAPPASPPVTPVKTTALPTLEEENVNGDAKVAGSQHPPDLDLSTPDSRAAPYTPLSPTSAESHSHLQHRPLGVRKFLSLRSLRAESRRHRGELSPTGTEFAFDGSNSSRPSSPFTLQTRATADNARPSTSRKMSSSWFGSIGGRRKSRIMAVGRLDERLATSASPEQQKPSGPPAPKIPEFKLGSDLEMRGDDLFKDIK